MSHSFHRNEVIELSVILEIASVITFAIPIFEANELNISKNRPLSGLNFFALLLQFSFFIENVVVSNA